MPKAKKQPNVTSGFTIYIAGMFGITKHEAVECEHKRDEGGVYVTFRVKGARKARGLHERANNASIVILEGWGHVQPDSSLVKIDARTERSRYASFDPRWRSDFDQKLADYLATSGAKVVADYRPKKTG